MAVCSLAVGSLFEEMLRISFVAFARPEVRTIPAITGRMRPRLRRSKTAVRNPRPFVILRMIHHGKPSGEDPETK
jgi:hypothetical protein